MNKNVEKVNQIINNCLSKDNLENDLLDIKSDFFNEDENVFCLWAGTSEKSQNVFWTIWSLEYLNSKQKIHIFTTNLTPKLNSLIKKYISTFKKEMVDNVRITELESEKLKEDFNFPTFKRAKRHGDESLFFHFNLFLLKSNKYDRLNIIHNDLVFLKEVDYRKSEFDINTQIWKIATGPDIEEISSYVSDYTIKFPSLFNVDLDDFYWNHFHNGFISFSKKSQLLFNDFFEKNENIIRDNFKLMNFPEQEIIKIFSQINSELKILDTNKYEGKIGKMILNKHLYIHLDTKAKGTYFYNLGLKSFFTYVFYPTYLKIKKQRNLIVDNIKKINDI